MTRPISMDLCERAMARLAEGQSVRQSEAERQASGIDHGVDLRRQSASGTTHATIRPPLFELAACW